MSERTLDRVLLILAAMLATVGVVMSVQTLNRTGERTSQIRDKVEREDALRKLKASASGSARSALDELDYGKPPDLRNVIDTLLKGSEPAIKLRDPVPIQGPWFLHAADLKIPEVSMQSLAPIIAGIESEKPPWRVTGCAIHATGNQPGTVRASLTLEALSK